MTNSKTDTKSPQQPVQARAIETRARIIEVAMKTFAERGYDGANTRDIADEAGATHGAIRYHFGTKEELWKKTIETMFRQLRLEVYGEDGAELLEIENPVRSMREFLSRYIQYSANNPDHARIMISESVRGGPRLEWMAENFIKPSHKILMKETRKQIKSGLLPDLPPVSMFYIIVSMCQMPFVLSKEIKLLHKLDLQKKPAIEQHIDAVMAVLVRNDH